MTERLILVAVIAALTYPTRYAGFALGRFGGQSMPPALERFLNYVPIAAFAALVAPGVADGPGALTSRVVAIGVAAVVAIRFKRLWAALILGMVGFWVVDFLVG
jgi:branched-subunit amino acid transport protein